MDQKKQAQAMDAPGVARDNDFSLTLSEKRCGNANCINREESGTSFKRCSHCKIVYYCSAHCQRTDWKNGHNKVCRKESSVLSESVASLSLADQFTTTKSADEDQNVGPAPGPSRSLELIDIDDSEENGAENNEKGVKITSEVSGNELIVTFSVEGVTTAAGIEAEIEDNILKVYAPSLKESPLSLALEHAVDVESCKVALKKKRKSQTSSLIVAKFRLLASFAYD